VEGKKKKIPTNCCTAVSLVIVDSKMIIGSKIENLIAGFAQHEFCFEESRGKFNIS